MNGTVIKVDPDLPCGIKKPNSICGRPSQVAHVFPNGEAGEMTILPVCRECAVAAASNYEKPPN